jgi:quercetin dioxygenase-like cupin family protein
MIAFQLDELELMEGWVERQPRLRGRFAFPLTAAQGAAASSLIYFEIAPGDVVLRHTHSAEEVLVILAGEAEIEVDAERAAGREGSVVLVPANAAHGVVSTGKETLRVVGFFPSAGMVSTYEATLQPMGVDVLVTPDPEAAIAATGMRGA